MTINQNAELSKIANQLLEAKERAQSLKAELLVYLIQCAIDEAADIASAKVPLQRS